MKLPHHTAARYLVPLREGGFGSSEGDPEIRDLLRASIGFNMGLQYLEGALFLMVIVAASLSVVFSVGLRDRPLVAA